MNRSRFGFTLIELLVVIAIIAILAAILFPIFVSAKQRAQATQCMSNMGQIGKAITMYADENNGCTPFGYYAPDWSRWDRSTWRDRIVPYLRSKRALVCPIRTHEPDASHFQVPSPYWPDYWKQEHYGMNIYVVVPGPTEGLQPGFRPIGTIPAPTKTILITENKDGDWSGEPWDNKDTGAEGQFWAYHGAKDTMGGNFVFCDGHASFMPIARTQATISNVRFFYWMIKKTP